MPDDDRIEDRLQPVLVIAAWGIALPIGAITALYCGHDGLAGALAINALALGWCDI